jgi:HAMP domain-containing protein
MLKRGKIGTRLFLGIAIVIAIQISVALLVINQMNHLAALTVKLYDHPYTVRTEVLEINRDIIKIHRDMKDVAMATNKGEIKRLIHHVDESEQEVYSHFEIIKDRFLGDPVLYHQALDSFRAWKPIRDEVLYLMERGRRKSAASITKQKGAKHVEALLALTQDLDDFAQNKAIEFLQMAKKRKRNSLTYSYSLLLLSVIIGFIISYFLTRSIVRPLAILGDVTDKVSQGDFDQTIEHVGSGEIGDLGDSINNMTAQLREESEANKQQIWRKDGLSMINDIMRGEQNPRDIANELCQFIANYIGSQIVTFYVMEEGKLNLLGSYAFDKQSQKNESIAIGEGFVGQAAKDKELISILNIPDDYMRVKSSLGEAQPKSIVVVPFLYNNQTQGVMEIGSFKDQPPESIDFLKGIMEPLGMSIRSVTEQLKTKKLLKVSQRQAEEMKTQEEELRASNENLEEQTRLFKQLQQSKWQQNGASE